ncbi:MAG: ADP-forming succinate--CoA ligase subunit beta [Pseudomonadota bacterium]
MHLHEYQAKHLLADHGIPVPAGLVAASTTEAADAARDLEGSAWMVKAQVHAGGRGQAGGVRRVESAKEAAAAAGELLGSRLVTAQTGPEGLPVGRVLVEATSTVEQELYLAVLVDREAERIAFIASATGGMDIEAVAAEDPSRIHTVHIDPATGLMPHHARELGFALGLEEAPRGDLASVMSGLYEVFTTADCSLVEINPLGVTPAGELLAMDAKVELEGNAAYRHPERHGLDDPDQGDPREARAREFGLNYVALDGTIGCMVNGAGLAMATMDLIKLHGGEPANFLDVGGGTTAERVAEAFKLIRTDDSVRAILVNIFGGIVRCDLIAEGILAAVEEAGVDVPIVVRLEGTNAEAGRRLLAASGVELITAAGLDEAAARVVAAGRGD